MDMLNYNVPEAERNAAFRQGYISGKIYTRRVSV